MEQVKREMERKLMGEASFKPKTNESRKGEPEKNPFTVVERLYERAEE